jgi:transcriptional regulator GlxA family with amidase domain
MNVAFYLYPRFTALDWIGPHEVFNSVPDIECITVAETAGPVPNEAGNIEIIATHARDDVDSTDILLIPGGYGTRPLIEDEPTLDWVRAIHETTTYTTSVCTGALVLAAAGLLDGLPATTHWFERDLLGELGAKPVPDRVVEQGKVVTAAGVSSGIDMALRLVQRIYGDEASQAVQLGIEYDPQPPFDCGALEKADPQIAEAVKTVMKAAQEKALAEA